MNAKEKYFEELTELGDEPLFIANSNEELELEVARNLCLISISGDIAKVTSVDDFITFFNSLLLSREAEIKEKLVQQKMIFYAWFDEMAGQLRFNFISSDHDNLPFTANLRRVTLEKIIKDFLSSMFQGGIPAEDFEGSLVEDTSNDFVLEVFSKLIP